MMDWMRFSFYIPSRLAVKHICRTNTENQTLEWISKLPLVEGSMPPSSSLGIVYTSCNDAYLWKYVKRLLYSVHQNSSAHHFHLHLYDPSSTAIDFLHEQEKLQNLSVSWEYTEHSPSILAVNGGLYYVMARFVRMWQFLRASRSPIFAIDADSVIKNNLAAAFSRQNGNDVAIFLRKRADPLRKVLGAALMAFPTELGLQFMRDCAAVFSYYILKGAWETIDQLIIYLVWRWYKRNVSGFQVGVLNKEYSDWKFHRDSFVWHAKGKRKLDESILKLSS